MTSREQRRQLQIITCALIERYGAVLYPVDLNVLFGRLPELGWVVSYHSDAQSLSIESAPAKGNVRLAFDQGNKTLGVRGRHLEETIDAYEEIHDLVSDLTAFPPQVSLDYLELRYIVVVRSESNPPEAITKWWKGHARLNRLSEKIAQELPSDAQQLTQYVLKLTPSGLDANRPNWIDIQVQPQNRAGSDGWYVDVVYRNESSGTVLGVARRVDGLVNDILDDLET